MGEVTLLNSEELVIDQDWASKSPDCVYSEPNPIGIRVKLKVVEGVPERNLMKRALKEWMIRRSTVSVDMDDVSSEAIVKFCDILLEQTRENLRENANDKQAKVVSAILTKIKNDYESSDVIEVGDREALGSCLRLMRVARGITVRGLADDCGLSPATVQNIEKGSFSPRLDIVEKILVRMGARMVIKQ